MKDIWCNSWKNIYLLIPLALYNVLKKSKPILALFSFCYIPENTEIIMTKYRVPKYGDFNIQTFSCPILLMMIIYKWRSHFPLFEGNRHKHDC